MDVIEPASIAAQSPLMLLDYLSSMQAKTFSTMSAIELGDMQIPGWHLLSLYLTYILKLTFRQKHPLQIRLFGLVPEL